MSKEQKIKEYKSHEEVDKIYRWDLDDLLQGKSIEYWIDTFFNLYEKAIQVKDSKFESFEKFFESIKLDEEMQIVSNKVSNYIGNKMSINVIDNDIKSLEESFSFKANEFSKRHGSEINRIFAHEEKIREWLKNPLLEDYRIDFEDIFDKRKHKLSDEIEEFLITISRAGIDPYEVFSILSNTELVYKKAIGEDGKEYEVSDGIFPALMQNKDGKVRKESFESYFDAHYQHANSFAQLLFEKFKKQAVWSDVRKYPSVVESFLSEDKVNIKLLHTIYQICKKNRHIFKKHFDLKSKFYEAQFGKKMERWDERLPLVSVNPSYSIEEAQKLVINSLEPFGDEYYPKVKNAILNERWVDYLPVKNKRSGAYSIGSSYGVDKKYILMNFDGTLRSVETLAHEMGHSMHSYFADKHQKPHNAEYPIFLAEIASIFNELMLTDYLLKNSNSDELKYQILNNLIEGFEGSVMRQVEWSNFEFNLYNEIAKGNPYSTYEQISNLYYKNAKEYERSWTIKKDPKLLIRSVTVPHYYYNFYVYKYAIGQICANIFFEKYKHGGAKELQNYINNFLKQGGVDWPLNILAKSGINLYESQTYEIAFKRIEQRIAQFEEIGNKIFVKNNLTK